MNAPQSFGEWLRHRRRELDLTQDALARQVGCARITIRKLEADEMRPSRQLAELLAEQLGIPSEEREKYVRFGRGGSPVGLTTTAPRHNLPINPSSFVGRQRELAAVKQMLKSSRLVTLTGSGGIGKTRLALQAASELRDAYQDGVWWVDLAPLMDDALAPQAVAQVLGVRESSSQPLTESLENLLREKRLLLVLDNCEHLITACAQLADDLLTHCANFRILATSREVLGITGEMVYEVPSLALPKSQYLTLANLLMEYEGIRLFVERACAVKSDFTLTEQNAAAVLQICRRLDGISLALELAAARTKLLSVEQIAERLNDRFHLLTRGSRTALPRHQTLRAAIDWSHDLLTEPEYILFRRLAIFAGGFTLEAAEAVTAGDDVSKSQVTDLLGQLINKSLVTIAAHSEDADAGTRYGMLETIGQYAAEKLAESVEGDRVSACHLQFYLQLAEESEPHLTGADQAHWLERLDAEKDNFRAALEWALSGMTSEDVLLRFVGALCKFWPRRGYFAEAREWLSRALAQTDATTPTPARAKVLDRAGYLAYLQCDFDAARQYFNDGLAARQKFSDKRAIAESWRGLGVVEHMQGNYEAARTCYEESLTLCREAGDKWGIATALSNLGVIAFDCQDYTSARELFEECLTLRRELDDRSGIAYLLNHLGYIAWYRADYVLAKKLNQRSLIIRQELGDKWGIAYSLDGLGLVAWQEGDYALAHTYYKESLRLFRELGDAWRIAGALARLASLAASQGQSVRAAHLLSAAEALRQPIHAQLSPAERIDYERQVELVRAQLDKAAFASAWAVGHAMTMEQAIEFALQSGS